MRISDWSSDVCSSDLRSFRNAPNLQPVSALQTVTAGVNTRSFALFGQLDNHLTDEVTLSIGGRYTDEKRKLVDARVFSLGNLVQDVRAAAPDTAPQTRDFTGKFGLTWEPSSDQTYYRSEEHTSELQSLMRISYA